ncbi:hypothetical protein J2801_002801 [Paraburkholderia phenoliruptrix]|uniref:hypothetical protein n=1 Tax=Paraburkholderia phenoliruptrix TaxID=252970 RepID=UPI0028548672|nr:hypothetical protein [Paraburkholderia phenoliruptrix]MDR6420520.1 hypothetical protein [Paraburkholderia phenoliruptrix]
MWDQLGWWTSDIWECFKSWCIALWGFLGNRTVGTLLTAVPAALASYFTLQASLKANETGIRSLQVSESSQRLAQAADARQQRENSAEIFGKLDKEKCWQVSASDASCRFFFTLTNAGKYTAEHLVSVVNVRSLSFEDKLAGDLPAGQVTTNVTKDFRFRQPG